MNDRIFLHRRIPFKTSPDVLVARSREIIKKAGYPEKCTDSAHGFAANSDLLRYFEISDKTANRWKNLDAKAILFWYRQSPIPLESGFEYLGPDIPAFRFSGEILVKLDAEGRLVSFRSIPPQERSIGPISAPDWAALFKEAGLDPVQWKPSDAQQNPPYYADSMAAWNNSLPNRSGAPARIEAAALQGRLVSFEIIGPKTSEGQPGFSASQTLAVLFGFLTILAIGGFFARRNLRLGRGDRRNATRLALFIIIFHTVCRAFGWHYAPTMAMAIALAICLSLFFAAFSWIFYTAMEPFVRRQWPQVLVSWTRLLSGEWRDPLVARDVLAGCAMGLLILDMRLLGRHLVPSWLGYPELSPPAQFEYKIVLGTRFFISELMDMFGGPLLVTFLVICSLFLLRVLLRNQKAAVAAISMLMAVASGTNGNPWSLPVSLVGAVLLVFVLMRFGLVSFLASLFIANLLSDTPATLDSSAWYFGYGFAALAIFAAIVLYSFRTSLGGRPLLATSRLDD